MKKNIPAIQWAKDVISGKVKAGLLTRLACERHFNDLKTGLDRGLYYDQKAADRAISFFGFLHHYKGVMAGKVFTLDPWQQFIISMLFGWKNSDGSRRFNYSYTEVARKNGKTMLAGGFGLYMLDADNEASSEVYSAATSRDQAMICFDAAKSMVRKSPHLRKHIGVYMYNLHVIETASKFEPIASEADSLDGPSPHGCIIDEYHAHKTNAVFNVLKSGMGQRRQPMIMIITTAGFNQQSPCYQYRENVIKVLKNILQDDSLFGIIFTLDDEDDWNDKANWSKANPLLQQGNEILEKYLDKEYKQAVNNPQQFRTNFLTKNLNIWVNAKTTWIPDEQWMITNDVDINNNLGMTCYAAIDLGAVSDITCLGLLFEKEEESIDFIPYFFVPEDIIWDVYNRVGINYPQWVKDGFLIATPGNITDYDFIEHYVNGLIKKVKIKRLAYDRWNASQVIIHIQDMGVEVSPYGQGFASMSTPTKEIERLVSMGKLNHGGNPVLRWMCSNVAIEQDAAGNKKMHKGKSTGKIDGMVTLAMCIGEYLTDKAKGVSEKSIYETQELRTL